MCLIPYVKIDVFAYFTYDTNCLCFVKMYILYSLPVRSYICYISRLNRFICWTTFVKNCTYFTCIFFKNLYENLYMLYLCRVSTTFVNIYLLYL